MGGGRSGEGARHGRGREGERGGVSSRSEGEEGLELEEKRERRVSF